MKYMKNKICKVQELVIDVKVIRDGKKRKTIWWTEEVKEVVKLKMKLSKMAQK